MKLFGTLMGAGMCASLVLAAAPANAVERGEAEAALEGLYDLVCYADREFERLRRLQLDETLDFGDEVTEDFARDEVTRLGVDVDACLAEYVYEPSLDRIYFDVLSYDEGLDDQGRPIAGHVPVIGINLTAELEAEAAAARADPGAVTAGVDPQTGAEPVANGGAGADPTRGGDQALAPDATPSAGPGAQRTPVPRPQALRPVAPDALALARVPAPPLSAFVVGCAGPSNADEAPCFEAAYALCNEREPGTAGLVRGANPSVFSVSCIPSEGEYVLSYQELGRYDAGCAGPREALAPPCLSAAGAWCATNAAGESALVQAVRSNGVRIACLTASLREVVPIAALSAAFPACDTPEEATDLVCTAAIQRWCGAQGAGGAGFTQGQTPDGFDIACLRPVRNEAVDTR